MSGSAALQIGPESTCNRGALNCQKDGGDCTESGGDPFGRLGGVPAASAKAPLGKGCPAEECAFSSGGSRFICDEFFTKLGTDLLVSILCRLAPSDLACCARVCRRFRQLYLDDEKLWLPLCEWRWGAATAVRSWAREPHRMQPGDEASGGSWQENGRKGGTGGQLKEEGGPLTYRQLYGVLEEWEPLIGFWRGVGAGLSGSLVAFGWRRSYIEGVRIVPSGKGCFGVTSVPFLRLGLAANGKVACHVDTFWRSACGNGDRAGSWTAAWSSELSSGLSASRSFQGSAIHTDSSEQEIQSPGRMGSRRRDNASESHGWGQGSGGSGLEQPGFPGREITGRGPGKRRGDSSQSASLYMSPHSFSRSYSPASSPSPSPSPTPSPLQMGLFPHSSTAGTTSSSPVPSLSYSPTHTSECLRKTPLSSPAGTSGRRQTSTPTSVGHSRGSRSEAATWQKYTPALRDALPLPDWNPEQIQPAGVIPVVVKFIGDHVLVIEEASCQQAPLGVRQVAVDATLASFGSSENLAELACSPPAVQSGLRSQRGASPLLEPLGELGRGGRGPHSPASQSPPSGLPYEMYAYLASRVASSGGDRAGRKQRKRERSRAALRGRAAAPFEPEHLVWVPPAQLEPSRKRPLQGLWKGISVRDSLEFIFVSYDEDGTIFCRRVAQHQPAGSEEEPRGSVRWTAVARSHKKAPLSASERRLYEKRRHLGPLWASGDEEAGGQLGLDGRLGFGGSFGSGQRGSLWPMGGSDDLAGNAESVLGSGGGGGLGEEMHNVRTWNGAGPSRDGVGEGGRLAVEGERNTSSYEWHRMGNDGGSDSEAEAQGLAQEDISLSMERLQFGEDEGEGPCGEEEEVVGVYCTYQEGSSSSRNRRPVEGRLWYYASGNFGYGSGHTDYVIDYRRVVIGGVLADTVR